MAYPGPYAIESWTPFNLTAFKNPGKYELTTEKIPDLQASPTDECAMTNSSSLQVLDGSTSSRILLKSCMDKCVVAKIPVTDQINALGQTEQDLEAGDLIYVKMAIPINNTVDVYCHAQSAKIAGIGESPF